MMRIFESLLEESNKKKFIKNWLGDDTEKIEEYDKAYEEYRQVFDNEIKKRGLNWQTSMNLGIFEEILNGVNERKSKADLKKQNKVAGKSAFLSYVLANPDCDLTYLGTLCKWDYFKIETWPGAMLADSPKSSLNGDTGAKWCIGWKDPAKQKFDDYTEEGFDFILIVKSNNSNTDKEEKYCIQIKREEDVVEAIWTPIDDRINNREKIGKILYGQESKIEDGRISGIFKGIDIGIKKLIQPENKIVDIGAYAGEQNDTTGNIFYYKLYKSGTDQLINNIKTLEFIDLKPLPKDFFHLVELNKLEKIILPEGLRVIGDNYFSSDYDSRSGCLDDITHIDIPDSVEEIGDNAFYGTIFKNLESIKLPANLKKIGRSAFGYCENLKHIEIPDSVEEIGKKAFDLCRRLEFVKLPANLKRIDNSMFYCCTNLKNIVIPDSVEEIGDLVFERCYNLESIKLPANLKKIGEICFNYCENLKHIEIPDSVEEIGKGTFVDCTSLKSVKLPANLKKINNGLFMGCFDLSRIEIPDSVEEIGLKAFGSCELLGSVKMPANLKIIGKQCFSYCESLMYIDIPDTVEEIGNGAFYDTGITDQNLIDEIKSINEKAFTK